MHDDNDNKNTEDENSLNDNSSDLAKERILETDNRSLDGINETTETKIDPIVEANESLATMNSTPFDQTLEIMSQTLISIENKMDIENSQLQKLDQLSEIKKKLSRLENANTTAAMEDDNESNDNIYATTKIEEENPPEIIRGDQQEISALLERIVILEKKILVIENQSNSSNETIKKIDTTVRSFEDPESPMQLTESEKYTSNIIKDSETSLENMNDEILINRNNDEEIFEEQNKPKNSSNRIIIFLLLILTIIVIFLLNKLQIINLDYFIRDIIYLYNTLFI